jgi:nucleoside-diphosphate-sugar epimerase
MDTAKPTIVVTGVSGNLGQRLIPQLADYRVVGVDITPPTHSLVDRFVPLDLGDEESTREMLLLLRELQPVSVVHLAFVIDPQRSGVLDVDRMWRINVAGTARMMEAITEANRNAGATIRQFIFPSSVSAYGSDLPTPAAEDQPWALTHCPTPSTRRKAIWWCSNARLPCADAVFSFCVPTFSREPPWKIT